MAVNLDGTFYVTRAFIPDLEHNAGRVINISSIAGREGTSLLAAYCAAKHGVVGLTRALAEELRAAKVSVNAICPGSVDTAMLREGMPGARPDMTPDDIARTVAVPVAHGAQPRSPAPVSTYSASRRATMVSDTFDPPEPDALAELPIFPLPNCVLLAGRPPAAPRVRAALPRAHPRLPLGQAADGDRPAPPGLRADLLRPPAGLRTLRRRPHHLLRGAARRPLRPAPPRHRARRDRARAAARARLPLRRGAPARRCVRRSAKTRASTTAS